MALTRLAKLLFSLVELPRCLFVDSGAGFKYRPRDYLVDGLNSLRYKLVASEPRPLYTWLLVTLPPHPTYFTAAKYRNAFNISADAGLSAMRSTCDCFCSLLLVVCCTIILFRRL